MRSSLLVEIFKRHKLIHILLYFRGMIDIIYATGVAAHREVAVQDWAINLCGRSTIKSTAFRWAGGSRMVGPVVRGVPRCQLIK